MRPERAGAPPDGIQSELDSSELNNVIWPLFCTSRCNCRPEEEKTLWGNRKYSCSKDFQAQYAGPSGKSAVGRVKCWEMENG
jgi:hypothetical protein